MLSNNKLEFLKELQADNFYPFTKDIDEEVYDFIIELKNMEIIYLIDYQVSIKNHEAIDEMINSKTTNHLESHLSQQNTPNVKTANNNLKRTIIKFITLLAAIAGIILAVLEIMDRIK